MAKREAFKVMQHRGAGLWSWVSGRGAVRYSTKYWAQPTCERRPGEGDRLSVFRSQRTAAAFIWPWTRDTGEVQIWRCMYRGKPEKYDSNPADPPNPVGTLRVTSVKLIERVWPKDGSK